MVEANEPSKRSPKKTYFIAALVFILCGLAYTIYWIGWAQYKETTDDAYVNGNMITITPQIDGIVTTILVDNTQLVEAGQVMVEIDRHDYEIAFEKAKADLAESVRAVTQLFLKVVELQAKKERMRAHLLKSSLDYEHRSFLVEDGSVSREDFEHSETAVMADYAAVVEADKELDRAVAEVEFTTIATHPRVEQMKAAVRTTFLALHRCRVLAPTRGIVTQRKAQVGQWVKGYDPLMALVPIDQMWVDANFREVSLKHFRIGQSVKFTADMYGSSVVYHGKIVGLNPGTGSVFSILPPQNATGNWIKILQRVPVKISIDPEELKQHPLVLGLSTTATVDTRKRRGLQLPITTNIKPIYFSEVYQNELSGVEGIIDEIISANTWVQEDE